MSPLRLILPFLRRLRAAPLPCLLALALAAGLPPAARAADIEITRAQLELSEDGYRLSAAYAFDLPANIENSIQRGIQMYFTTTIEITHPRWYWTDEKVLSKSQTTRIVYDPLTRQYRVTLLGQGQGLGSGSVQHNFDTLEDALLTLRRPSRWTVAPRGALKPGETYNVTIQMGLDPDFLSKPLQVSTFTSSDWRLASKRKSFNYKAE